MNAHNRILTLITLLAGVALTSCGGGDNNNRNVSPIVNNGGNNFGGGGACITAINGIVQTNGIIGVSFNGQAVANAWGANTLVTQGALNAGPGGAIQGNVNSPNMFFDQNSSGDRLQLTIQSQNQQIGGGGFFGGSMPVNVTVNGQLQLSGTMVNYIATAAGLNNPYYYQQPFGGLQGQQQFTQVACVTSVSTGGGYYGGQQFVVIPQLGGAAIIQGDLILTIGGQGGQQSIGYAPPVPVLF